MTNLFGEDEVDPPRRARSRKPKPATVPPAVTRVIEAYHTAYLERFGVKGQITGGKDGALVKSMIKTWGVDEVLRLLALYIQCNEPWAVRRGWTLSAFYELAPRLLTRGSRTSSNAATMRRAMESIAAAGRKKELPDGNRNGE